MNRRSVLQWLIGTVAASRARVSCSASVTPNGRETDLRDLLDVMFQEQLALSPQSMTRYGIDRSDRWRAARYALDDRSEIGLARERELRSRQLQRLRAFKREGLTGRSCTDYDVVSYDLGTQVLGDTFGYGIGRGIPYVLTQLTGAYWDVPQFLLSSHAIENQEDARAYLSRLKEFGRALDQDTQRLEQQAAQGVAPPSFILDRILAQQEATLASDPRRHRLTTYLLQATGKLGISGDWESEAVDTLRDTVYPSLQRQHASATKLRHKVSRTAGMGRLPHGEAYYRYAFRQQTTLDVMPEEVSRLGTDLVAQTSAALDVALRELGLTRGPVAERLKALRSDPRYAYHNTPQDRQRYLDAFRSTATAMWAQLPTVFGELPEHNAQIIAVPPDQEAGAAGAAYVEAAPGSHLPGVVYLNLANLSNPSWAIPDLVFHEAVPGHHLQISLAQRERNVPGIVRALDFNAYSEGWAMYAEQLADEIGMYSNDPVGRIGYLNSRLMRAVRLIVDPGLHHGAWSREQAINYMMSTVAWSAESAAAEIDRYCVMPGQPCTYIMGMDAWLQSRSAYREKMGAAYDIRRFHDTRLLAGPVPLDLLRMA